MIITNTQCNEVMIPEDQIQNAPTLIQCDHENKDMLKAFARRNGLRYGWEVNTKGLYYCADSFKYASLVAIWNGNHNNSALVKRLCQKRYIDHFFFENGMLPQAETYFIDPMGFCADSILNKSLSWITETDMDNLYRRRKALQKLYPLSSEDFILCPMQLDNDSSVLYYSRYNGMEEFVADVIAEFPSERIIIRPHPAVDAVKHYNLDGVEERSGGEFLAMAAARKLTFVHLFYTM